jgi:hypothetical protein
MRRPGVENVKTGLEKLRKGDNKTDHGLYDVRDCAF